MTNVRAHLIKQFAAIRPAGGARVISVDFPWAFETRSDAGQEKCPDYDTMTIEEVKQTPIDYLAATDCVMFMWVTWPLMPHWNDIIEALGFEYSGLAWEWVKYNPETGKYAFGPGYGTRKNLEPCLLAMRGNPKMRPNIDLPLFGEAKPVGVRSVRDFMEIWPLDSMRQPRDEHSRKPDEQYIRMETMFEGPYVELFARQRYPGWIAWGNEVDKFEVRAAS